MITIKKLAFSYGDNMVLKDISMKLEEGCIYGLLGENGVGKTTLLTLLAGLKKVNEGSIDIDGYNPFDRKPSFLSNIYYLPDEVAAVKTKALDYAADQGQFWTNFDLNKFRKIMEIFENDDNIRMDRMSYGQLKKTYISFALACNARYLLMDEPTNGLDIPSKAQFRKAVSKYTSDDSTLLISTHQVRDLEALIDPIIILDRRDVLLNASLDEITQRLYFDYSSAVDDEALYSESIPGGCIQVLRNTTGIESKVNIEALFNTVHLHKDLIKEMFNNKES
jgi:ABC-2 type transport system ATP-binding protein